MPKLSSLNRLALLHQDTKKDTLQRGILELRGGGLSEQYPIINLQAAAGSIVLGKIVWMSRALCLIPKYGHEKDHKEKGHANDCDQGDMLSPRHVARIVFDAQSATWLEVHSAK